MDSLTHMQSVLCWVLDVVVCGAVVHAHSSIVCEECWHTICVLPGVCDEPFAVLL